MRITSGLFAVILVALSCRGEKYTAKIVSGDEVELVYAAKGHELIVRKQGEAARIRLVGIYTFDSLIQEKNDITVYGEAAVNFVQTKARGTPIRLVLEREEPDPRGRFLAFAEIGGVDLGRQLIEEGHAAVYTEFPFSREADYLMLEDRTRRDVRGLWGGTAARKRIAALRETWAAVRSREFSDPVNDPLMKTTR